MDEKTRQEQVEHWRRFGSEGMLENGMALLGLLDAMQRRVLLIRDQFDARHYEHEASLLECNARDLQAFVEMFVKSMRSYTENTVQAWGGMPDLYETRLGPVVRPKDQAVF